MTESESKVEEVARAICAAEQGHEDFWNDHKYTYEMMARAAIEAMRDNPPDASEVLRQKHINGYPIWTVLADANLDASTYWSIHQAIFVSALNEGGE